MKFFMSTTLAGSIYDTNNQKDKKNVKNENI